MTPHSGFGPNFESLPAVADDRDAPEEIEPEIECGQSGNSIGAYLSDLRKMPRLTAEEEIELAQLIVAGGPAGDAARQRMIEANARLVVFLAKRLANRGFDLLDLVSAGNLALIKAVDKFDAEKGCRFATFAGLRIVRSMQWSIGEMARTVRLPQHIIDSLRKLAKAERQLEQELGRAPELEELAERVGVKPKKALALLRVVRSVASLDAPVGDGEDDLRLADIIPAMGNAQEFGLIDRMAEGERSA